MNVEGHGTTQAPEVGSGKAMQLAAEKAYDEIAEREGLDEHGDEIVDMSGDDEPVGDDPAEDTGGEGSAVEDPAEPVAEDGGGEENEDPDPEPEVEGEPEEPPMAASGEPSAEPLVAPHTWPEDWKMAFNSVSPQMQGIMLEQNKHMNKAFSEKMMEIGRRRRELDGVEKAVTPHVERLNRAGIGPDVAVARALGWDEHIQRDPQQGIRDMAQAYGVDLGELSKPADSDRYLTPTERALKEENQGLAKTVEQIQADQARFAEAQRNSAWRSRQARAYHMLQEFMNATDEAGNRLHPYIEHVAPTMTRLIDKGEADDLEDAYNKAFAWHPEIREAREIARETRRKKDAQDAVKKARKASSGIVQTGGRQKKPKAPKTFEQTVSETYDKIANA